MRKRIIGIGYFLVLSIASVAFEACEGAVEHEPPLSEDASVDSPSLFDIFYSDQFMPGSGPPPPACLNGQGLGGEINPYSPPVAHQNVCTQTDINDFYDQCLNLSTDAAACDDFGESRTACASCLEGELPCRLQHPDDLPEVACDGGDDGDAGNVANSWPPIVPVSQVAIVPDTGACIASLSSASDDCKTAYAREWSCEESLCSNCVASDFAACRSWAAQFGCPSFVTITPACLATINEVDPNEAITQCAAALPDGGLPDLHSGYATVATTLCGP